MTDPASARDRHLFGAGPKRILSLDGGGVRGALSIAFLERIEALLATGSGAPASLSDHFDLVGGTSTGAIIAGGLALGLSAEALHDLYHRLARKIFRHEWWRFPVLQAKFDAAHLRAELQAIVGDRRLDSPDLRTGFCVVTKRMDTGSPWILANNPRGRFWNDPPDGRFIGNRAFPLAALIRASTAAPHYFEPEVIDVLAAGEQGLFVDGAISPYNNPALQLTLLATLPQHGIAWPLGPRNLTVVSVGTGTFRNQMPLAGHGRVPALGLALRALAGLIGDTQSLTVGLMQALGETPTPWAINSEVGAMEGWPLPGGPLFRHVRYDVRLETEWLRDHLDLALASRDVLRLRRMDDPGCVADLYGIGRLAAERQVRPAHLDLQGSDHA